MTGFDFFPFPVLDAADLKRPWDELRYMHTYSIKGRWFSACSWTNARFPVQAVLADVLWHIRYAMSYHEEFYVVNDRDWIGVVTPVAPCTAPTRPFDCSGTCPLGCIKYGHTPSPGHGLNADGTYHTVDLIPFDIYQGDDSLLEEAFPPPERPWVCVSCGPEGGCEQDSRIRPTRCGNGRFCSWRPYKEVYQ